MEPHHSTDRMDWRLIVLVLPSVEVGPSQISNSGTAKLCKLSFHTASSAGKMLCVPRGSGIPSVVAGCPGFTYSGGRSFTKCRAPACQLTKKQSCWCYVTDSMLQCYTYFCCTFAVWRINKAHIWFTVSVAWEKLTHVEQMSSRQIKLAYAGMLQVAVDQIHGQSRYADCQHMRKIYSNYYNMYGTLGQWETCHINKHQNSILKL